MPTNTNPAAETLTALQDAEACLDAIAGRLDREGFLQLALLCADQAGVSVSDGNMLAAFLRTTPLAAADHRDHACASVTVGDGAFCRICGDTLA